MIACCSSLKSPDSPHITATAHGTVGGNRRRGRQEDGAIGGSGHRRRGQQEEGTTGDNSGRGQQGEGTAGEGDNRMRGE